MSQKALLIWALTASFIAVGAIGYSVGKQTGGVGTDQRVSRSPTESPLTTQPGAASEAVPEYVVPHEFAELPQEWRSPAVSKLEGYSVLFNPATRQAIVELCRHNGYQLDEAGRPLELFGEFCTSTLNGELRSLTQEEAVVNTRDGRTVSLKLEVDLTLKPATLLMQLDGHKIQLIPGSRNELLQAMERDPAMKERKQRYFKAANSREVGKESVVDRSTGRTD